MIYDFGYRLRELRENKKLTQSQVAKRLHLSKAVISGYENNTKTPSLESLKKLAGFYGVTTDYLLGLEPRQAIFVDGLSQQQQQLLQSFVAELRQLKKA